MAAAHQNLLLGNLPNFWQQSYAAQLAKASMEYAKVHAARSPPNIRIPYNSRLEFNSRFNNHSGSQQSYTTQMHHNRLHSPTNSHSSSSDHNSPSSSPKNRIPSSSSGISNTILSKHVISSPLRNTHITSPFTVERLCNNVSPNQDKTSTDNTPPSIPLTITISEKCSNLKQEYPHTIGNMKQMISDLGSS